MRIREFLAQDYPCPECGAGYGDIKYDCIADAENLTAVRRIYCLQCGYELQMESDSKEDIFDAWMEEPRQSV